MLMKPKIVVFAGPNGSGKSTLTGSTTICGTHINADVIQKIPNRYYDWGFVKGDKMRCTYTVE